MEAIVAAVITGVVTLLGVLVTSSRNVAVISAKVDELSRRVEKHNSLIERTYALERDVALVRRDVDALLDMREEPHHG